MRFGALRVFILRMWTLALAGIATAGCTVIRVEGAKSVTLIKPGILRIEPADNTSMVAYRSTGVGIVPGVSGVTFGVASEQAVMLASDSRCQMVVFETAASSRSETARAFWRDLAARHPSICVQEGKP